MNKMVRMIKQQNVVTAKQSQSALIEGLKKKREEEQQQQKIWRMETSTGQRTMHRVCRPVEGHFELDKSMQSTRGN